MPNVQMAALAAGPFLDVVHGVTPDTVDAPTPCTDYSVRGLVNHLLFWGPSLEGAARKDAVPPPAESEAEVDLTVGDWAKALDAQTQRVVAAWSEPAAWAGTTQLGMPMELPADMIGAMVVGELVVHGWDLARATGQRAIWPEALLDWLLVEAAKTAEQGREMGVYGARVHVGDAAPTLHRLLGLTGRHAEWRAVALPSR